MPKELTLQPLKQRKINWLKCLRVSEDQEVKMAREKGYIGTEQDDAKKFIGRLDRIDFNSDFTDVEIFDDFGVNILYDVAINDLIQLEDNLIRTGSYFIYL
jgi:tetrahydromethanopterin S-methyltransferase subunit G